MGDNSTPASILNRYAFNGTLTTADRLSAPSITLNGSDLSTTLSSIDTVITSVSGVVDGLSTTVTGIDTTVTGLSSTVTTLSTDLDTLSSTVDGLSTTVTGIDTTVTTLSGTVTTIDTELDALSGTVGSLSTTVTGINTTVTGLSTTVTGINTTVTTLSGTVTTIDTELDALSGTVTTLSGTVTGLSTNLDALSGTVTTLSGTVTGLSTNLGTLTTTVNNIEPNIENGTIIALRATNADNIYVSQVNENNTGNYYIPFVSGVGGNQSCFAESNFVFNPATDTATLPTVSVTGNVTIDSNRAITLGGITIQQASTTYPFGHLTAYSCGSGGLTLYKENSSSSVIIDDLTNDLVYTETLQFLTRSYVDEYNFISNTFSGENNTTPTLILPAPDLTMYGRKLHLIKYTPDGSIGTKRVILQMSNGRFFVTNKLISSYVLDESLWSSVSFICVKNPATGGGPLDEYCWLQTSFH